MVGDFGLIPKGKEMTIRTIAAIALAGIFIVPNPGLTAQNDEPSVSDTRAKQAAIAEMVKVEQEIEFHLPDGTPFRVTKSGIPQAKRAWVEPGDEVVLLAPKKKTKNMRLPDGTPFFDVKGGIPQAHRGWAQTGDKVVLLAPKALTANEEKAAKGKKHKAKKKALINQIRQLQSDVAELRRIVESLQKDRNRADK